MRSFQRLGRFCSVWCFGSAIFLLPGFLAAAEVYPLDLGLTTPPGAMNTFEITMSGDVLGSGRSDTDSGTVSGNLLASIGMSFHPDTFAVTSVDTLEFTGGHIAFTDMSFKLDWGFIIGSLSITSSGIGGTADTPVPPGLVTNFEFNAADHEIILNEGTFTADGSGTIAGFMPSDPYVIDLAAAPASASTAATGTIAVSAPSIAGGNATYTLTLTLPIVLDQIVFEEPGTASMRVLGEGTLEASGTFSRPLPSYGVISVPSWTALEEAAAGATSFTRSAGQKELAWTMTPTRVTTYAAVDGSFTDPDDANNHRQFHVHNADVLVTSEKINVRGLTNLRLALDIRTWDLTTGFEPVDRIAATILASSNGVYFEEIPWINLAGADATALDKEQNGAFTTFITPAGLIPGTVRSIQVAIAARNDSDNEHMMWDNLRILKTPPFRRGDCNADGAVDISDAIRNIYWLFGPSAEPSCLNACDANDDQKVDLVDPVFTLNYLFLKGSAPPIPGPAACGLERTVEGSPTCLSYTRCP